MNANKSGPAGDPPKGAYKRRKPKEKQKPVTAGSSLEDVLAGLEDENKRRRRLGLPTLSYGKYVQELEAKK